MRNYWYDDESPLPGSQRPSVNPDRSSLLDLARLPGDAALRQTVPDTDGATLRPPEDTARFHERYAFLGMLGKGGMGEVRLYHDRTIGREVAMKVIRNSLDGSPRRWRFVREARVQGQLEHPSVVPLYDLGVDPDGNLYFTMMRIHGISLAQVFERKREGDFSPRFSRRRLLSVFSHVCMAVDFFHSRGVIHRDLKPENVMIGEFGEVFVLDWGIAKVLAVDHHAGGVIDASQASATGRGSVLGTPGFMSPEQLRGEVDGVGPASDVYSLGAILFEILTLQELHPQDKMQAKLLSVLQDDGGAPSLRAPQQSIPKELDAICMRATRLDPTARYGSTGDLSDAIEAYLDSALSRA